MLKLNEIIKLTINRNSLLRINVVIAFCLMIFITSCDNATTPQIKGIDTTTIVNIDTNIYKSKSFELVNLEDSVSQKYDSLHKTQGSLQCNFRVKNISTAKVYYYVTMKKIQTISEHYIIWCMGNVCSSMRIGELPDVWQSSKDIDNELAPAGSLEPNAVTADIINYISISAKDYANIDIYYPGVDIFRIAYINLYDPTDFISFICYFNFYE